MKLGIKQKRAIHAGSHLAHKVGIEEYLCSYFGKKYHGKGYLKKYYQLSQNELKDKHYEYTQLGFIMRNIQSMHYMEDPHKTKVLDFFKKIINLYFKTPLKGCLRHRG